MISLSLSLSLIRQNSYLKEFSLILSYYSGLTYLENYTTFLLFLLLLFILTLRILSSILKIIIVLCRFVLCRSSEKLNLKRENVKKCKEEKKTSQLSFGLFSSSLCISWIEKAQKITKKKERKKMQKNLKKKIEFENMKGIVKGEGENKWKEWIFSHKRAS